MLILASNPLKRNWLNQFQATQWCPLQRLTPGNAITFTSCLSVATETWAAVEWFKSCLSRPKIKLIFKTTAFVHPNSLSFHAVQLALLTNCSFCVRFCAQVCTVIFVSFFSFFTQFKKMEKNKARKAFAVLYIISVSLILQMCNWCQTHQKASYVP